MMFDLDGVFEALMYAVIVMVIVSFGIGYLVGVIL